MKVAIVTCDKVPRLIESERQLLSLFLKKGIHASAAVWDDEEEDWSKYDAIIIRSVWDYHLKIESFLKWIEKIEQLNIKVYNSPKVIKWNHNKVYLKELSEAGYNVIPTDFIENKDALNIYSPNWEKAVIKPAISASSYRTELFESSEWEKVRERHLYYNDDHYYLIQKFIPEIQSFGELSIIFFNRQYAYTIVKTAKLNEFRVQSEFGGSSRLYKPPSSVISAASDILSYVKGDILYARIDGTIINEEFVLMEAELIEPDLFFEYQEGAREEFVQAFLDMSGF